MQIKGKTVRIKAVNNKTISYLPEIVFEIWIGDHSPSPEKRLPCLAESEEIACLLAIGYIHEGSNSKFVKYAVRMLGINSLWAELDE